MSEQRGKPVPIPDPVSGGFWEGCREGELRLQRCGDCNRLQFYPRALCTNCGSLNLLWCPASGRASVFSFTVVRRHQAPWWVAELPYVVAVVELEEGPHMLTNLVEIEPDKVRIGMQVSVKFRQTDKEEVRLPVFRPAG